jgi:hypothetical protein
MDEKVGDWRDGLYSFTIHPDPLGRAIAESFDREEAMTRKENALEQVGVAFKYIGEQCGVMDQESIDFYTREREEAHAAAEANQNFRS